MTKLFKLLKVKTVTILFIVLSVALSVTCLALDFNQASAAASNIQESNVKVGTNLTPYAWYKFEDPNNIGKDEMGRNNLISHTMGTGTITQGSEGGDGYVSFRRNQSTGGKGTSGIGGLLHAEQLDNTGKDFSDNIVGSYTLSITFRDVIDGKDGSNYIVTTGLYYDAPTIAAYGTHDTLGKLFEVQTWTRHYMLNDTTNQDDIDQPDDQWANVSEGERNSGVVRIQKDTKVWTTVTIVGDAENKQTRIYVDGTLKWTKATEVVAFSNRGEKAGATGADYVFAIGGQCSYRGGYQMHANADVKDCKVFDYALSNDNVAQLCSDSAVNYTGKSIKSLPNLDVSDVDFTVTNAHSVKSVFKELPQTANVTLSDNSTKSVPIIWTTQNTDKIYGFPSESANIKGLYYVYDYSYVVKLRYNPEAITISDFKVAGVSYEPNEVVEVTAAKCSISFCLEFNDGYLVSDFDGVYYGKDMNLFYEDDWVADDGYIMFNKKKNDGALIEIIMLGEELIGDDVLNAPADETTDDSNSKDETTDKTNTPTTNKTTNDEGSGCGCGSSIVSTGVLSLLSVAGFGLIIKRRRND